MMPQLCEDTVLFCYCAAFDLSLGAIKAKTPPHPSLSISLHNVLYLKLNLYYRLISDDLGFLQFLPTFSFLQVPSLERAYFN